MSGGVHVELKSGLCASIGEAAAAAVPERRFLQPAWYDEETAAITSLVVRDAGGACLLALPLVRRGPIRAVPGSYWPFRTVPVASALTAAQAGAALASAGARSALGLAIRLGPICERDPALALLTPAFAAAGYRLVSRTLGRCFVQDLDALRREAQWPRPRALARNARRLRQLEAAAGPLRWQWVRGRDWSPELIGTLARVEAATWLAASRAGRLTFASKDGARRWRRLAADPAITAHLSACLLWAGERPLAYSVDIDAGAARFGIASGYDRAFHQHSPGRLLHYHNIADALRLGLQRLEWGCGDSGYKREFGAVAGPRLIDCLYVRDWAGLPHLAHLFWRSASDGPAGDGAGEPEA